MIVIDTVAKKLAVKWQTTELNIRREYLQHLFLSYFYQNKGTEQICFKGGTALRIVYQSPRFSEDLDFSAYKFSRIHFDSLITQTLMSISREGIKTNIQEAKTTSGGFLYILEFELKEERIEILVQISKRETTLLSEIVTIANSFIPTYPIYLLAQIKLIEEKLAALFSRQKPRDFYDLYYMLRANLLTNQQKKQLNKVLELEQLKLVDFKHELEQFLPRNYWPGIKSFSKSLKQEIERFS